MLFVFCSSCRGAKNIHVLMSEEFSILCAMQEQEYVRESVGRGGIQGWREME